MQQALDNLEWDTIGSHFIGHRAEEMEDISTRLLNLAKEDKGIKAREFKDAA